MKKNLTNLIIGIYITIWIFIFGMVLNFVEVDDGAFGLKNIIVLFSSILFWHLVVLDTFFIVKYVKERK